MKRALLIVLLAAFLVVLAAVLAFNSGVLHDPIERRARAALGADVRLGSMFLRYRWPILVQVGTSTVGHPLAEIAWRSLEVEVVRILPPQKLRVRIVEPVVTWKSTATPAAGSPPAPERAAGGTSGGGPTPLGLRLEVIGGTLRHPTAEVRGLNLNFEQNLLLKSAARVQAEAVLRAAGLPVTWPVKISSEALTLTADTVKTAAVRLRLGGIDAVLQGASFLKEERHRWKLDLEAKDLAKVPQPELGIPATGWRGSLRVSVDVSKPSTAAKWTADARVNARDLSATAKLNRDGVVLNGPIRADVQGRFGFADDAFTVDALSARVDLGAALVEYGGILAKAGGIPLELDLRARGEGPNVALESFALKLGALSAKANGRVATKTPYPAGLQMQLEPAPLAGLERFLPALRASPVAGEVALAAAFRGPLADPRKASVRVSDLRLRKFSASVNSAMGERARIEGAVRADVEGQGEWSAGVLRGLSGSAAVDLSSARIEAKDILQKPMGVPLTLSARARGDAKHVDLDSFEVRLDRVHARASGRVETGEPYPSKVRFQILPTQLQGLEKLLLPMAAWPMQGTLSARGAFDGALMQATSGRITIDEFRLKNFRTGLKYEKPGSVLVNGPISADVDGAGEWSGNSPKSARLSGMIDLSAAALVLGPLRKESRAAFAVQVRLRSQGEKFVFSASRLRSFFGTVDFEGSVERPQAPALDVRVKSAGLLLNELRVALPEMRDRIPKGSLGFDLRLKGSIPAGDKPWFDWPILVSGAIDARLPEYVLAAETAPAKPSPAATPAAGTPVSSEAASFLPKGELTSKARLKIAARIDALKNESLTAAGVSADGEVASGRYTGNAAVAKVFGGRIEAKNLNVPLLEANPTLQGTLGFHDLSIGEALAYAKPEYKGMAEGRLHGLSEFATKPPSDPAFLHALRARGDVVAKPVTLNSVKLGATVNELLAKVPMLKLKPVKVEPLRGEMKMAFDLAKAVMNVTSLNALDEGGSELQMKGKASLADMRGDFAGQFFWADPRVKGCLREGNSDAKGRMIVPLAMRGDLLKPSLGLLSDTAAKLAEKALACEGKKLVEKVKTEGREKLEDEVKKRLKGIFGD